MATTFSWSQPTNLRNNAAPVDPSDAATKAYVDAQVTEPSGPNGAVQFNSANALAGSSGFTTDGQNITIGGNITGSDLNIIDSGNITFNPAGNVIMSNNNINGLANPVQAQDAATKTYVDSVAQGLQVKTACQLATATALPTNTYSNGIGGVGATLTATANSPLTVDGVLVAIGYRILVKNEAAPANNGIYVVTSAGGVGSQYVLTRTADCDQTSEFNGAYTFIQGGDTNSTSGWICTASASNPVTVGTTAVTFVEFSRAGVYTAGPGLTLTGTQFTPDVDGTTVYVNPSNQISIPADAPLTTPVLTGATGDNLTLSYQLSADLGTFSDVEIAGGASIGGDLTVVSVYSNGNIDTNIVNANAAIIDEIQATYIQGPSLVITTTDTNGIITLSPQGTGNVSVDGSWITGVNNPVNAQDAATKSYVDTSISAGYSNANVASYLPTYSGNIGTNGMNSVNIGANAGSGATNSIAIGPYAADTNQSNLAVAIGFFAGGNVQGTNTVAIGHAAGGELQGTMGIAIGNQAAYSNQQNSAIAIGNSAGQYNQGNNAIAIGNTAAPTNQADNSIVINASGAELNATGAGFFVAPVRSDNSNVALSVYYNTSTKELTYSTVGNSSYANANVAGYLSSTYTDRLGVANVIAIGQGTSNVFVTNTTNTIAIGTNAGNNFTSANFNDTPPNFISIGTNAGQSPLLRDSIAIGNVAGQNSQGEWSVAIGWQAGQNTQGRAAVALGTHAANTAQGIGGVAIGAEAGALYQGNTAVALGDGSGANIQGTSAVAIGAAAGANNQGNNSIAIGSYAGRGSSSAQGANSIAIGANAASVTQGTQSIAIGLNAAYIYQGNNSIAMGSSAGNNTQGNNAIAIGTGAAQVGQGIGAVAIGNTAGNTNQGVSAVAIGVNAAANTQGLAAIAVGTNAGLNLQGQGGIAIGADSGVTNQGFGAVSLGYYSSQLNQGNGAITIGAYSGQYNQAANSISIGAFSSSGGANSIVIGANANTSLTNTIVLNASGNSVIGNTANSSFYVNPVRNVNSANAVLNSVYYNPSTSELSYSETTQGARTPFNAVAGNSSVTLDNLMVGLSRSAPTSVIISSATGSFQASWGGTGIANNNVVPISQQTWVTVTAGSWYSLSDIELVNTGDTYTVILANQSIGLMYRITVQLLSSTQYYAMIERLL